MKRFALLPALLLLASCEETSKVSVKCTYALAGASCAVSRLSGKVPVDVTWRINLNCANGELIQADGDEQIGGGAGTTVMRMVEWSEFNGVKRCDKVQSSSVSNINVINIVH